MQGWMIQEFDLLRRFENFKMVKHSMNATEWVLLPLLYLQYEIDLQPTNKEYSVDKKQPIDSETVKSTVSEEHKEAKQTSINITEIVSELLDRKDQKTAKAEPIWAFIGAWAVNIASWIFFISVGSGAINLLPMILCMGAVAISILKIRPVHGKWKHVTIVSIFDSIWMLVWIFL